MVKNYSNKKITALSLLDTIYSYDSYLGLLFKKEEMVKEKRFDSLIDYYENPNQKTKIQFLKRPIYRTIGYIYKGCLEPFEPKPAMQSSSFRSG